MKKMNIILVLFLMFSFLNFKALNAEITCNFNETVKENIAGDLIDTV